MSISINDFQTEFCAPIKAVEAWVTSLRRQHGKVAETSLALKRVAKMLCTDRGRVKVLGCMRDKIPLHGTLNSNDYGIEECRNIVMELKKARGVEAAPAANEGQTLLLANEAGGADAAVAASPAKPGASSAIDDVDDGMHIVMEGVGTRTDPVHDRAKAMVEQDLAHIARHHATKRIQGGGHETRVDMPA